MGGGCGLRVPGARTHLTSQWGLTLVLILDPVLVRTFRMGPMYGSVVVARLRGGCRHENLDGRGDWAEVRWRLPAGVAFPCVGWRLNRLLIGANASDSGNPHAKLHRQSNPPARDVVGTLDVATTCSIPRERRT